jgi:phage terminase large subunit
LNKAAKELLIINAELERRKQEREKRLERRNEIFSIVDDFPGRYIVLIGGSGSGKSYHVADVLIERCKAEVKSRILGVRAQRNQVTD